MNREGDAFKDMLDGRTINRTRSARWLDDLGGEKLQAKCTSLVRISRKPTTHAVEIFADAHADELYHVGVPASRKRANLSAHELGEVREGGVT